MIHFFILIFWFTDTSQDLYTAAWANLYIAAAIYIAVSSATVLETITRPCWTRRLGKPRMWPSGTGLCVVALYRLSCTVSASRRAFYGSRTMAQSLGWSTGSYFTLDTVGSIFQAFCHSRFHQEKVKALWLQHKNHNITATEGRRRCQTEDVKLK